MSSKNTRRKLTLESNSSITSLFKDNPDHEVFREIQNKYNVELKINAIGVLVAKGDKNSTLELEIKFKSFPQAPKTIEDLKSLMDNEMPIISPDECHVTDLEFKDSNGRVSLIHPKNEHQKEFMEAMDTHKVILGMGSAGTGKTFLAVAKAIKMLETRKVGKVVISRPAITAGESIGFLPGDKDEKMGPFLAPVLSILEEIVGTERRDKLILENKVEILPVGYARGLTIGNRFGVIFIIDEAQNLEFMQHKLLLTRLGSHPNSKIIMCGDQRQSDLKNAKDTYTKIHKIIKDSPYVASVVFTKEDVVRSEAVKDILGRIEDYEDNR